MRLAFSACLLSALLLFSASLVQADDGPTKEDIELSKVPALRISEPRLKKVFAALGRQYKHMYAHAAADGYIVPQEKSELHFQRRLLTRIHAIDQHYQELKRKLHTLQIAKMDSDTHKRKYAEYTQEMAESEATIRRFACRHIDGYPKKNPSHCAKTKG